MRLRLINEATITDVQRRVPIWIKKYFDNNELKAGKILPDIVSADPTNGKYSEWLIRQWKNGTARFPEDNEKLSENLTLFDKKKSRLDNKDINAYTPGTLAQTLSQQFKATGSERRDARKGGIQLPLGAELIANKGAMKAVKITTPEASSILCSGTEWCVANKETAEEYLKQGPLYLIYVNDERKYLVHEESNQFMDVYDNEIYDDEDNSSLLGLKTKIEIIDLLSPIFELDANLAFTYANKIAKGRWPYGEQAIAQHSHLSFLYAKNIIHGRFPAGEPAIMKNPKAAYQYAADVIRGRWLEAEPIIAQNNYAENYAQEVIRGRWPEAEPFIAKNAWRSCWYAINVLNGRFPAGEPAIMNDPHTSKMYQSHINWLEMMSEDE